MPAKISRGQSSGARATHQRSAIAVPRWSSLSHGLRFELQRSTDNLKRWDAFDPDLPGALAEKHVAPLSHHLSDHFMAANGPPESKRRSTVEFCVLQTHGSAILEAARDRDAFLASLDQAIAKLEPRSTRRTAHEASVIRGDIADIRFLPEAEVTLQLEQIRLLLLSPQRPHRALFDGAAALLLLTNAHPYRDGNGRLGRLLFNLCLRRGGLPDQSYVALSEIANRSRGGYEIRLRQAELFGQWEPFLGFLAALIDIQFAAQELTV